MTLRFRRRGVACFAASIGVVLPCTSCDAFGRGGGLSRVTELPGLSRVEYDGLNLRVERDAKSGMQLYVQGVAEESADLRQTDTFWTTDGQARYRAYEVLLLDEQRIVLKETEIDDHRGDQRLIRSERVIEVVPYAPRRDE